MIRVNLLPVREVEREAGRRQDVVWREHPDDLSAFTRAALTGGEIARPADGQGGAPVRLLGRPTS